VSHDTVLCNLSALGTRRRMSDRPLLVVAALVGLFGGLLAAAFRWLLVYSERLFFGGIGASLTRIHPGLIVAVPVIGALIVGPIIFFLAREAKGHGVPEVMEAVALKGGRIRPIVVLVKAVASAISIGSGGSVGREGPIVQMGSAFGSSIGQLLRVPQRVIVTLLACGAAAGISATFNAPIAGVFFALEIILGRFTARNFSLLVVASVAASVVSHALFGEAPAFQIPAYNLVHPAELLLYLFLGIIAALVARFFVVAVYGAEDLFDRIRWLPEWAKPALGGLLLGAIGLYYPQVFGVGYGTLERVLHEQLPIALLIILPLAKLLATSLTLGSGGSGGVFAPSLFLGGTLGAAFGWLMHAAFPFWTATHGAYALVGMAAVVAAATHAPITAVVILFEMTRDYRIILPLLIAVAIAVTVAQLFARGNIYSTKLLRRGINLERGKDVDLLRRATVGEAMVRDVVTVSEDGTVGEVIKLMQESRHNGFPVVDSQQRLVGIITLDDVRATPLEGRLELPVRKVMTSPVITTTPESSLRDALRKMHQHHAARLPVVSEADHGTLAGILSRSDIINVYNQMVLTD